MLHQTSNTLIIFLDFEPSVKPENTPFISSKHKQNNIQIIINNSVPIYMEKYILGFSVN